MNNTTAISPHRPNAATDHEDLFREALANHRAGNIAQACELYGRVLDLSPDFADAWHLMGVAAIQASAAEDAVEAIERAIALDSQRAEFHANLGTALQALGQTGPAEAAHRRAIELRPDYADAHYNLANLLQDGGQLKAALGHYRSAIGARPEFPEAHCNIGNLLFSLEHLDDAVAAFETAVRQRPDLIEGHYNLGNCYLALEEADLAQTAFERVLALDPDHIDAWINLSQVNLRQRQFERSRDCIRRAIARQPQQARHHRLLGNTYIQEGRPDDAIEPYRRAVALDPDNGFGQHILNALTGETSTAAPETYVRELFDACAGNFEKQLVGRLQYSVPRHLKNTLDRVCPGRRFSAALDLGCGTGLMGAQLADVADHLVGMDLSEKMIHQCEKKAIYHRLVAGNIVALEEHFAEKFDLIVAADVVIYLGDLQPLFAAIAAVARPGAILAFSTEQLNAADGDFRLLSSGRFAHSRRYIQKLASKFDLSELDCREAKVRLEAGLQLNGDIFAFAFSK